MVIAPKVTAPFVRICGDFRRINTYIVAQSDNIPAVRKEIEKARNFSLFTDADLRASFHQIPLAEYSSQRLAIQTVWGTFRPGFVPEGTSPASFCLQKIVQGIFEDFSDWMIVIFDNLLILGNTYEEIYDKTTKVIDRCYERNVKLKMSKCWLGVKKVSFFGYEIENNCYGLGQQRRDNINKIPMPKDTKGMQQLLGMALYFKTHIPNCSMLTADLHEMVRKDFVSDRDKWTKDYDAKLEALKQGIMSSATLHFPDYSLRWYLRCDASNQACGGTLLQEHVDPVTEAKELQVIAFVSTKFSGSTALWPTNKKECYSLYYSVKDLCIS
jgi:hypothetical protein